MAEEAIKRFPLRLFHEVYVISIIYRDFEYWPPYQAGIVEDNLEHAITENLFWGMIFIGFVDRKILQARWRDELKVFFG